MQNDDQQTGVDNKRRRFLTAAATVVGGAGVVATAVPFVSTLSPSAKTKAVGGSVEVDVGNLGAGEKATVKWRGKPVWIIRRSQETLDDLAAMEEQLQDPMSEASVQPRYAKNDRRSIRPEYLVVVGLCTHLGCSPSYLAGDDVHSLGNDWKGGFFCPCHGSRFDLAGRVFKSVPAPTNLIVPKHRFINDSTLLIGEDGVDS